MTDTDPTEHLTLLGFRELQQIFPTHAENTLYRWNSASGGRARQLPEPYRTVSGTPMWTEQQVLDFIEHKGGMGHMRVDLEALDMICAMQTGHVSTSAGV